MRPLQFAKSMLGGMGPSALKHFWNHFSTIDDWMYHPVLKRVKDRSRQNLSWLLVLYDLVKNWTITVSTLVPTCWNEVWRQSASMWMVLNSTTILNLLCGACRAHCAPMETQLGTVSLPTDFCYQLPTDLLTAQNARNASLRYGKSNFRWWSSLTHQCENGTFHGLNGEHAA